jgi:hypothetical protein
MRVKSVLWPKVGLRGPTCQAAQPTRVARQPSLLPTLTLGIGYPMHRPSLTCWQSVAGKAPTPSRPAMEVGGRPHFGSVGPGLCATSSPRVIFSVTMPYF